MSKSKNILVTGGAGYIGSHACKALARAGYTPVAFDNLVYGHTESVKWGPLEVGDIQDRARLEQVINRYKPEAVMHFAAYAYVGESVLNPGKYYRNNVAGTLTLLEALIDNGINKLIFSSTCATYGVPDVVPVCENQAQKPINPYGASKLMIERILKDYDHAHSLRSISLRYFNAAGADADSEIGEAHNPETHLIPLILDVAAGNSLAIQIFGQDYETPDGTCIRDYIHVSDLADAHILAMNALESGSATAAYNLGNGQGYSVRQIISAVEKVTGKKINFEICNRRVGDPPKLVGDPSLANERLKWFPKCSNIENIVETAWKWHVKTQS